ncbi:MAG: YtxH domain-containing protein [Leadbetterella sp.]
MAVSSKHLATFILGAAAGVALNKYLQSEEGEKLMEDLKTKGNELKDEAEAALEKAPQYFEDLKNGASQKMTELVQNLKNQYPEAENMISELFSSLIKPAQK